MKIESFVNFLIFVYYFKSIATFNLIIFKQAIRKPDLIFTSSGRVLYLIIHKAQLLRFRLVRLLVVEPLPLSNEPAYAPRNALHKWHSMLQIHPYPE